jgi:dTDP-4-dehydrorhamnose reductase
MILVTGGSGQLGGAFGRLLPDARLPAREDLDLAFPDRLESLVAEAGPDAIINCAAYTAVDQAEAEEPLATLVNAQSVEALASYSARAGIPFVTFSTDYVFDGTATEPYLESDAPHPINAYGRSKLAGERAALRAYPAALVVRTSWMISGTHPNFLATMLRLARERDRFGVVSDQVGCPTSVDDLAPAVLAALAAGATGIVHLTNVGATTWFELARETLAAAGADPTKIEPIASSAYSTAARRPRFSVLGSERLTPLGLEPLPHWRDSLPDLVAELNSRA